MSDTQALYSDSQELATEICEYATEIETLGEQQKEHQEDLIKMQKLMLSFKSSRGVYGDSDSQVLQHIDSAMATSEQDIQTCKQETAAAKNKMEEKKQELEKLNQERERKLQESETANAALNHRQDSLEKSIDKQKTTITDVKDKMKQLSDAIIYANDLVSAVIGTASGLGMIIQTLRSIGILK
jgi:chromosome segregation ATPase